jgi:hypothetical protein
MSKDESREPDDPKPEDKSEDLGMPEGIAPPPMPKPDLHDIIKEGPTYGEEKMDRKKKKRRGKKDASGGGHPLDRVSINGRGPMQSKKGCCGCIGGCFVLVVLFFVALFVVVGWIGPARHLMKGYEVVNHFDSPTVTISEAPDKPTAYLGNEIIYNAPQTKVPVAIYGQNITVSGDFWETATLTGTKVTAMTTARFAKDLEIWAAEFIDEGLTLKGELQGRVIQNSDPPE